MKILAPILNMVFFGVGVSWFGLWAALPMAAVYLVGVCQCYAIMKD